MEASQAPQLDPAGPPPHVCPQACPADLLSTAGPPRAQGRSGWTSLAGRMVGPARGQQWPSPSPTAPAGTPGGPQGPVPSTGGQLPGHRVQGAGSRPLRANKIGTLHTWCRQRRAQRAQGGERQPTVTVSCFLRLASGVPNAQLSVRGGASPSRPAWATCALVPQARAMGHSQFLVKQEPVQGRAVRSSHNKPQGSRGIPRSERVS